MSSEPLPAPSTDIPLHLWGLTLGVMADFLDLLPPHDAIRLWIYPTFTAPDLQFVLWAISRGFRARKAKLLEQGIANMGSPITLGEGSQAAAVRNGSFSAALTPTGVATPDGNATLERETGIEVPSTGGQREGMTLKPKSASRSNAVESLLEGYYDYVQRAVQLTVLGRATLVGAVVFYIIRKKR
ncbi:MAG: hypothetical protein INR71_15315 [Terriglobus roseus]|nr:hypothetical protein [Terriglobus roseus]